MVFGMKFLLVQWINLALTVCDVPSSLCKSIDLSNKKNASMACKIISPATPGFFGNEPTPLLKATLGRFSGEYFISKNIILNINTLEIEYTHNDDMDSKIEPLTNMVFLSIHVLFWINVYYVSVSINTCNYQCWHCLHFENMIFRYSLQPTSSPKNYILTVPNHQTVLASP